MANTDIFGRQLQEIQQPFTADRALIIVDNQIVGSAVNFQLSYAQGVIKRRVIGGRKAVIYPTQPEGQISIARFFAFKGVPGQPESGLPAFGTGLWSVCNPGTVKFEMTGGACGDAVYSFTATGVVATNYGISAEAEGLTITDNIILSYLQLIPGDIPTVN
jgi:hypothetical protein